MPKPSHRNGRAAVAGPPAADPATPFWATRDGGRTARLFLGQVLDVLAVLPEKTYQAVVTSPPYWGLRNYNSPPFDWPAVTYRPTTDCPDEVTLPAWRGCFGMEPTPALYVAHSVLILRALRRVLRDDGVVYWNVGDSYAAGGTNRNGKGATGLTGGRDNDRSECGDVDAGLAPGNLTGVPWRVALALQADGWVLRQDVIWSKTNPMPESVQTRCTKAHEYVFMLTKTADYAYDHFAVRERAETPPDSPAGYAAKKDGLVTGEDYHLQNATPPDGRRNRRSVWTISTKSYKGAHFACVDSETEALTRSGWKKYNGLVNGAEIAVYDAPADKLIWSPSTFNVYDYDGPMVEFDKRDTSQLLTPDHRCFIKSRRGFGKVKRADELKRGEEFLLTAEFEETPEPGIGKDLAALIGWYTSEGHRGHKPDEIHITQSLTANPEKVEEIEKLLVRMKEPYKKRLSYRDDYDGKDRCTADFKVFGTAAAAVRRLCPRKEITDRLTRLPKDELTAMLDAFIKGDGTRRGDDHRACIYQKSKSHIDRLQVIAIKLGYRGVVTRQAGGTHTLYLTHNRWVTTSGTSGRWDGIKTVHYNGKVWCPTTVTGFWLARRHGRTFITGNCFPPDLPAVCVKAAAPERGACTECGRPWRRVVGSARTATRPGADTKVLDVETVLENRKINRTPGRTPTSSAPTLGSVVGNRDPGRHVTEFRTLGWYPECDCDGLPELPDPPAAGKDWAAKAIDKRFADTHGAHTGGDDDADSPVGVNNSPDYPAWESKVRTLLAAAKQVKTVPCRVLDPFSGSGTTVAVSVGLMRHADGVDVSETYTRNCAAVRVEGEMYSRPVLARLIPRRG